MGVPRKKADFRYPRACEILVNMREPTERERRIDPRLGAENPRTPSRPCGVEITDEADSSRHMASAHPDIWRTIQVLAEVRLRRLRSGK